MTKVQIIRQGNEFMHLYPDGRVARPESGWPPSESWRITGAVERNNLGRVVRRFTLADIASGVEIPWRWKNGTQRVFVLDVDHGTPREWRSPQHSIDRHSVKPSPIF